MEESDISVEVAQDLWIARFGSEWVSIEVLTDDKFWGKIARLLTTQLARCLAAEYHNSMMYRLDIINHNGKHNGTKN
jgi:hypothetical protein